MVTRVTQSLTRSDQEIVQRSDVIKVTHSHLSTRNRMMDGCQQKWQMWSGIVEKPWRESHTASQDTSQSVYCIKLLHVAATITCALMYRCITWHNNTSYWHRVKPLSLYNSDSDLFTFITSERLSCQASPPIQRGGRELDPCSTLIIFKAISLKCLM